MFTSLILIYLFGCLFSTMLLQAVFPNIIECYGKTVTIIIVMLSWITIYISLSNEQKF